MGKSPGICQGDMSRVCQVAQKTPICELEEIYIYIKLQRLLMKTEIFFVFILTVGIFHPELVCKYFKTSISKLVLI